MARLRTVPIAQGASGTTELVPAPTPSQRYIVVVNYLVVMDGGGTYRFESAANDLSGDIPADDKGGAACSGERGAAPLVCNRGEALNIVTSTGLAQGHLTYLVAN